MRFCRQALRRFSVISTSYPIERFLFCSSFCSSSSFLNSRTDYGYKNETQCVSATVPRPKRTGNAAHMRAARRPTPSPAPVDSWPPDARETDETSRPLANARRPVSRPAERHERVGNWGLALGFAPDCYARRKKTHGYSPSMIAFCALPCVPLQSLIRWSAPHHEKPQQPGCTATCPARFSLLTSHCLPQSPAALADS